MSEFKSTPGVAPEVKSYGSFDEKLKDLPDEVSENVVNTQPKVIPPKPFVPSSSLSKKAVKPVMAKGTKLVP